MPFVLFNDEQRLYPSIRTIAFTAYVCLVIFSAFHHVPFSDETDPWVIARDGNFTDFIHNFSYVGHPPLWYFINLPFARAGFPFEIMSAINACFAFAVAWLMLFRSPFSLPLVIAFLFTMFMSFQYAVVVRGYMLMILVLALLAILYPSRFKHPLRYGILLALLFNTEGFALLPAAALSLEFVWECRGQWRRYTAALALPLIGAVITTIALWPPDDRRERFRVLRHIPQGFFERMREGFTSFSLFKYMGFLRDWPDYGLPFLIPGVIILGLTAIYIGRTRWLAFMAAWLGWYYFIIAFKYPGNYWHSALLPVFVMITLWFCHHTKRINDKAGRALALFLMASFLVADLAGIGVHWMMIQTPYSGGKDMATAIHAQYPQAHVFSLACNGTTAVSAYLPDSEFWIAGEERFSRYLLWNEALDSCLNIEEITPALAKRIEEVARGHESVVVSMEPLKSSPELPLTLRHISPGFMHAYFLYTIGRSQ